MRWMAFVLTAFRVVLVVLRLLAPYVRYKAVC